MEVTVRMNIAENGSAQSLVVKMTNWITRTTRPDAEVSVIGYGEGCLAHSKMMSGDT